MFGDRFRVGDSSPRVAEVRGTLARLGFIDGFDGDAAGDGSQQWTPEDEYFDPALETAIQAFQQHRGIDADGTITDGTLRALREASYTLGARVLSPCSRPMRTSSVTTSPSSSHTCWNWGSSPAGWTATSGRTPTPQYGSTS